MVLVKLFVFLSMTPLSIAMLRMLVTGNYLGNTGPLIFRLIISIAAAVFSARALWDAWKNWGNK